MADTQVPTQPTTPASRRGLISLIVVGVLLVGGGWGVRSSFWLQDRLLKDRDRMALEGIAASEPNNYIAQFHLAKRRYEVRQFQEATICLDRVIQANPKWDIARYNYGLVLYQTGKTSEAQLQFEQAARLNPNLSQAVFMLACLSIARGKIEDGLTGIKEAIRMNPKDPHFYWGYGRFMIEMNQMEEAIPSLKNAVALDPKNVEYHTALGEAYTLKGEAVLAKQELDLALAINPEFAQALALGGAYYLNNGTGADSLTKAESMLKKSTLKKTLIPGQVWYYLGQVYTQQNKPQEAYNAYHQALKFDFAGEVVYFGLANAARKLNKTKEVAKYQDEYERLQALRLQIPLLAKHVRRIKDDADAHLTLARAYRSMQSNQKALKHYAEYLVLRDKDKVAYDEANKLYQKVWLEARKPLPDSVLPSLL